MAVTPEPFARLTQHTDAAASGTGLDRGLSLRSDRGPTGVGGDKTREASAMTPPRGSMCPVPDRLGLRRKPHDEADGGVRMKHRIAAIPGDGIGKDVVPEGRRVIDAAVQFAAAPT